MTCPFKPLEFNVAVELDPTESKTPGGIILLDTATERDKLGVQEGTLVAVSPLAFSYADWPEDSPPPTVGERVLFARYAGLVREHEGRTFRLIKDKDIVAVIPPAAEARKEAA
jgi:chaperonin GroES